MKQLFTPRLPEVARNRLRTGGTHKTEKKPSRARAKQQLRSQFRKQAYD